MSSDHLHTTASDRPPPARRHPAGLPIDDLLADCEAGRSRSSGPGGQHRNKVETRVELIHTPTGTHASAGERRSAIENHHVAVRRLRLALAVEHREFVPDGEARSPMWIERTRTGRIGVSDRHEDFPAMLAEAMDMLWACAFDVRRASLRLDVSQSQLIRLLRRHPPALATFNAARSERGKSTYR